MYVNSSILKSRLEQLNQKADSCSTEELSALLEETLSLAKDSIESLSVAEEKLNILFNV